jgi:hypothetical protein
LNPNKESCMRLERLLTRALDSTLDRFAEPRRLPRDPFSVFGVFSLGALLGGLAALLYAPRTGRELRDKIGRNIDSVRRRVPSEAPTSQPS